MGEPGDDGHCPRLRARCPAGAPPQHRSRCNVAFPPPPLRGAAPARRGLPSQNSTAGRLDVVGELRRVVRLAQPGDPDTQLAVPAEHRVRLDPGRGSGPCRQHASWVACPAQLRARRRVLGRAELAARPRRAPSAEAEPASVQVPSSAGRLGPRPRHRPVAGPALRCSSRHRRQARRRAWIGTEREREGDVVGTEWTVATAEISDRASYAADSVQPTPREPASSKSRLEQVGRGAAEWRDLVEARSGNRGVGRHATRDGLIPGSRSHAPPRPRCAHLVGRAADRRRRAEGPRREGRSGRAADQRAGGGSAPARRRCTSRRRAGPPGRKGTGWWRQQEGTGQAGSRTPWRGQP